VGRRSMLVAVLAVAASWAMGAAAASAQPVTCGQVITQDTTLESDLECGGEGGTALVIGASGITLDLGGHTILTYDQGILNEGHDDVAIRNGTVSAETGDIVLRGVERNEISNVRAEGLVSGFVVSDSDHNRFLSNRLVSVDFSLSGSNWNTIRGNEIVAHESLLMLKDSSHNRVVENHVEAEDTAAFLVLGGGHNRIAANRFAASWWVQSSGASVAVFASSDDNDFVDNVVGPVAKPFVYRDTGVGIVDSSRTRVLHNRLLGNPRAVLIRSGAENVLKGNVGSGVLQDAFPPAPPDGFRVEEAAAGTLLQQNAASGFGDDGFDVEASGTRLKGNTANDNGDLGIEAVPGIVDLGGNRASGNGDPLQCLNVVCR
jgi:large repetitive protein